VRRKQGELSDVQFSKMTEREVWKLLTSRTGALEVSWPGSDDERIDLEAHIKETFGPRLCLQIKAASWLLTRKRARYLVINFEETLARVHSHPLFWYLFGHFDLDRLAFASPLFLIESGRFHREASPKVRGDTIQFRFAGNVEADSRDKWRDCAVEPLQLADRVVSILQQAQLSHGLVDDPLRIPSRGLVIGLKPSAAA
jgi:hypothetical protein